MEWHGGSLLLSGGVNIQNNPSVRSKPRRAVVGHCENNMRGTFRRATCSEFQPLGAARGRCDHGRLWRTRVCHLNCGKACISATCLRIVEPTVCKLLLVRIGA